MVPLSVPWLSVGGGVGGCADLAQPDIFRHISSPYTPPPAVGQDLLRRQQPGHCAAALPHAVPPCRWHAYHGRVCAVKCPRKPVVCPRKSERCDLFHLNSTPQSPRGVTIRNGAARLRCQQRLDSNRLERDGRNVVVRLDRSRVGFHDFGIPFAGRAERHRHHCFKSRQISYE